MGGSAKASLSASDPRLLVGNEGAHKILENRTRARLLRAAHVAKRAHTPPSARRGRSRLNPLDYECGESDAEGAEEAHEGSHEHVFDDAL